MSARIAHVRGGAACAPVAPVDGVRAILADGLGVGVNRALVVLLRHELVAARFGCLGAGLVYGRNILRSLCGRARRLVRGLAEIGEASAIHREPYISPWSLAYVLYELFEGLRQVVRALVLLRVGVDAKRLGDALACVRTIPESIQRCEKPPPRLCVRCSLTCDFDAFGVVSLDGAVQERLVQEAQDRERGALLRSDRRHCGRSQLYKGGERNGAP